MILTDRVYQRKWQTLVLHYRLLHSVQLSQSVNTTEVSILFYTDIFKVTCIYINKKKVTCMWSSHCSDAWMDIAHIDNHYSYFVWGRLALADRRRDPTPCKAALWCLYLSKKAERAMKRVYKGAISELFLCAGSVGFHSGEEIYLLCFWWFQACAVPLVSWAGRSEGRWSEGAVVGVRGWTVSWHESHLSVFTEHNPPSISPCYRMSIPALRT